MSATESSSCHTELSFSRLPAGQARVHIRTLAGSAAARCQAHVFAVVLETLLAWWRLPVQANRPHVQLGILSYSLIPDLRNDPVSRRADPGQQQIPFSAMSRNVSLSACAYEFYVTRVHDEAPCALIAAAFGVMPSPGPPGTAAYPSLPISGFSMPSTTLSYQESDASSM
jgi:hypothetical protein